MPVEQQLVNLGLEDGDVAKHPVNFCHLRWHMYRTCFALDEQFSIKLLYISAPQNYCQLILTPERTELRDFSALYALLRDTDLNKVPDTQIPITDMSPPYEDYMCWGVPEGIKSFGLAGDKNLLLEEGDTVTC
ncbi:hypothetical protein OPQ81_004953 [Rhizoctonia solani]|nr:hypothetical protein OPQ81_004953 [Rhizoctonia solani]